MADAPNRTRGHDSVADVVNYWIDGVTSDQDAASTPYALSLPIDWPKPDRALKRDRASAFMDNYDEESVVSSSGRSINPSLTTSGRRKLTPRSPTKTLSRSSSPSKKLLTLLERATPAVKCRDPNSISELPEHVASLREYLVKDLPIGVIPPQFKERLRETNNAAFQDIPSTAFSQEPTDEESISDVQARERLWQETAHAFSVARKCYLRRKDESAWVVAVWAILKTAGLDAESAVEVNSIQTQQIDPSLLPNVPGSSIPVPKRADLALGINPDHPSARSAIDRFLSENPTSSLSQMADVYTSGIPLVCGLEIKGIDGTYPDAIAQLAIWAAAGLRRLQELGAGSEEKGTRPLLGWTVIGHEWKLHLAWIEPNNDVVIYGPTNLLTCKTDDWHGLFTLLELIKRVRQWILDEYWPWFREVISVPEGHG